MQLWHPPARHYTISRFGSLLLPLLSRPVHAGGALVDPFGTATIRDRWESPPKQYCWKILAKRSAPATVCWIALDVPTPCPSTTRIRSRSGEKTCESHTCFRLGRSGVLPGPLWYLFYSTWIFLSLFLWRSLTPFPRRRRRGVASNV